MVVVGGGNAAIDAARTELRSGSDEVTIVYRRGRNEMPADALEVDEAEKEGIRFYFNASPREFVGEKKVNGLECIRTRLGHPRGGCRQV